MGMYTGFTLNCILKNNQPSIVTNVLEWMLKDKDSIENIYFAGGNIADHHRKLIEDESWQDLFFHNSCYLEDKFPNFHYLNDRELFVQFDTKHFRILDLFKKFISPHIDYLIMCREQYEECEYPTRLLLDNGNLIKIIERKDDE